MHFKIIRHICIKKKKKKNKKSKKFKKKKKTIKLKIIQCY